MNYVPSNWPEPRDLRLSLIQCGIRLEGMVAAAFARYEGAVLRLREFAEMARFRCGVGRREGGEGEWVEQQGIAAGALESLRALMRSGFGRERS